jgi:hypothetical protein
VTVETIDEDESESEYDEPSFFNNQARDTAEQAKLEEEPIWEAEPRLLCWVILPGILQESQVQSRNSSKILGI